MPERRGSYSACLQCDKAIWRMPAHIRDGHKIYCGQACRTEALKGKAFYTGPRLSGSDNPAWAGGPATHSCKQCGKRYTKTKTVVTSFCSIACKAQAGSIRIERQCAACAKPLIRRPCEIAEEVFCNKKCRGSLIGVRQKGEANPVWKGGVTPQNAIIRASAKMGEWRKAVFERDHYTCRHCAIRNHKGLGRSVAFHAHHIKEFHSHPELRFDVDNGLTLCAPCHRNVHRKAA